MLANSGYVMTLANSIIGVGILAMPFCFQKCGIVLAILLLVLSNWITRICCHYLIKTSLLTRRKSFEFLGFHAFGTSGKLLVELCIIGYLLGSCITYFVVVGDLGPQIVTKMFSLENEHRHLRTLLMCGVTLFCIIPLGMLKNVDSLSTVCTASIGFYVCLVIKIILESEMHIIANDWVEEVVYWQPSGVLQCLPIFSMALSCQMQIFEVFTSINNQSLEKLNGIVRNATWICNILMNLSTSFGSDVIKIGFVLSVAFSFPLVIFPCRASLYSLLYRKVPEKIRKRESLEESRKLVQNLMEKEQKDNLNKTKIIKEKPSPPPLPVDEPHPDVEQLEKVEEKPIKTLEDKSPVILTKDVQDNSNIVKKLSQNLTEIKDVNNNILQSDKQMPEKKTTAAGALEIQPQTIDNDAIKKDDEVAKEEYKQENEELKKTQKELEITKDLLEKKVEELKEELVKQNQETQNLVVEKLGEVVEKFEAIERKVKNQNEDNSPPKGDLKETSDNNVKKENENLNAVANETNNYKPNKGSLISILTDNRALNSMNLTHEKVYEPLSYKTGELMEQVQKNSTFEKRLPLPLALLINASQAKINESIKAKPSIQLNQFLDIQNKTQLITEPLQNNTQNQNLEKLNVDAIRRDILQLKPNLEETTTTNSNDDISSIHRN
ncbi:hypothetical protein DOY81_013280 [Sarcophaga bullata]|nr:hypothetical protein DOY81_013280 [Sarcophaga bullata]